jgi:hypothetical protein
MSSPLRRLLSKIKAGNSAEPLQIQQHAHVFISRIGQSAIIVTLHFNGAGGILFEDAAPSTVSPLDAVALGQATLNALQRTQILPARSFAGEKLRDWPAYQASKLSSVRMFEAQHIPILVSGANASNLIYTLEGELGKDEELRITASISSSAPAAKLGALLIKIYEACRDRRL